MLRNLPTAVAAKYSLVGIRPGKYNFKNFGEIDLCNISVARADDLFRKGFPHFKIRQGSTAETPAPAKQKVRPINVNKQKEQQPPAGISPEAIDEMRKNKKFINKLLTLDWKDLTEQDRKIFTNEAYFLEKKKTLQAISEIDREMKSLHANVKSIAKDESKTADRAVIMDQLSELEERKLELFATIDTWNIEEAETDLEKVAEKAAKEAIEKQKLIAAHENYIYRNEPSLDKMPESTTGQIKKKQAKADEIARRKTELIKLGKPYNRQSRG